MAVLFALAATLWAGCTNAPHPQPKSDEPVDEGTRALAAMNSRLEVTRLEDNSLCVQRFDTATDELLGCRRTPPGVSIQDRFVSSVTDRIDIDTLEVLERIPAMRSRCEDTNICDPFPEVAGYDLGREDDVCALRTRRAARRALGANVLDGPRTVVVAHSNDVFLAELLGLGEVLDRTCDIESSARRTRQFLDILADETDPAVREFFEAEDLLIKTVSQTEAGCNGLWAEGRCWSIGEPGWNCNLTCEDRQGAVPDPRSGEEAPKTCERVFNQLGAPGSIVGATRSDGKGLGCHRWSNGQLYWLSSPSFDAKDRSSQTERLCGCSGTWDGSPERTVYSDVSVFRASDPALCIGSVGDPADKRLGLETCTFDADQRFTVRQVISDSSPLKVQIQSAKGRCWASSRKGLRERNCNKGARRIQKQFFTLDRDPSTGIVQITDYRGRVIDFGGELVQLLARRTLPPDLYIPGSVVKIDARDRGPVGLDPDTGVLEVAESRLDALDFVVRNSAGNFVELAAQDADGTEICFGVNQESGEVRSQGCDAAARLRVDIVIADIDLEDSGLTLATASGDLLLAEDRPGARILVQRFAPESLALMATGAGGHGFAAVIGGGGGGATPPVDAKDGAWMWAATPPVANTNGVIITDGTYIIPTVNTPGQTDANITGRVTVLNGRPVSFAATLRPENLRPKGKRSDDKERSNWRKKNGQGVGSVCAAGHMFADSLGFNAGMNFMDQDSNTNSNGVWRRMEVSWTDWLAHWRKCGQQGEIQVLIEPQYGQNPDGTPNTTATPSSFRVTWTINEVQHMGGLEEIINCELDVDNYKPRTAPPDKNTQTKRRRLNPAPNCSGPQASRWQQPQGGGSGGGTSSACSERLDPTTGTAVLISCSNGESYAQDPVLDEGSTVYALCEDPARTIPVPLDYLDENVTDVQCQNLETLGLANNVDIDFESGPQNCTVFVTRTKGLVESEGADRVKDLEECEFEPGNGVPLKLPFNEYVNGEPVFTVATYTCNPVDCNGYERPSACSLSLNMTDWESACDTVSVDSPACSLAAKNYCVTAGFGGGFLAETSDGFAAACVAETNGGPTELSCTDGFGLVNGRCYEIDAGVEAGDTTCGGGARSSIYSAVAEACLLVDYQTAVELTVGEAQVTRSSAWEAFKTLVTDPKLDLIFAGVAAGIAGTFALDFFCPPCAAATLAADEAAISEALVAAEEVAAESEELEEALVEVQDFFKLKVD